MGLKGKPYNKGMCNDFKSYDREGNPFSGTMEEFEELHGPLHGLRNMNTGEIILISQYFEVAATVRYKE